MMFAYTQNTVNRIGWMLASLILLTVAVYWPVRHYGLVDYDDPTYLYDNPYIRQGITTAGLRDAFTHFRFVNYAPLVSISYYIDQDLFHLNPGPMHVENVMLHLIGGLLLWHLLFAATGSLNRSFVVAALFLLEPMHVESVAWISERKDVLSTALLLSAMIAYLKYCRQPSTGGKCAAYSLLFFLFAMSLLTKAMGVTLPALLLLLDYWPLDRWPSRSWTWLTIEKLPLVAASLIAMELAHLSQAVATTNLHALSLIDRIDNAIVCYVLYIVKLSVPIKLAVFYEHPGTRTTSSVIAAGGMLILATLLFYRLRTSRPYLIIGWFWFLGTLVPVIGLVQVGGQAMADRYSYLPSIGLSIAAVWGIHSVIKSRRLRMALAITTICIFSGLTARQVSYWRNSQTLFTHAAAVTDDNPVAHNVLSHIAYQNRDIKRAIDECNLALRYGDDARAYEGLGNCWSVSTLASDHEKAIKYYRKAIALDPGQADFHVHLAGALRADGELDQARTQVQAALTLLPDNPSAVAELAAIDAAEKKQHPDEQTTPLKN